MPAFPSTASPGASTVAELLRFGSRHHDTELVTSVRDREQLRAAPRTLDRPAGRHRRRGWPRLHRGGTSHACWSTTARLVTTHHHPDGSTQASEVNAGGADVFIGLRLDSGGRPLQHRLLRRVPLFLARGSPTGGAPRRRRCTRQSLALPDGGSQGMSLPLLRETRMPAVILEIGPGSGAGRTGCRHRPSDVDALAEWVAVHGTTR